MKLAFVTCLLMLGGPAIAPAADGLQMAIRADEPAGTGSAIRKFRIDLHNSGPADLVLNLGVMLANGKRQYATAVVLTLTDARGKSRQVQLREPTFVAGRMDPLVVPLPVGSTFSIPADLDNYWGAAFGEFDEPKPGPYTITAQFTGNGVSARAANLDVQGLALMPYWTGTVTSNPLRFELAAH